MKNISATKSSYQQNPGSTFQVFSPRRSLALSLAYVSCDTVLWSQLSARGLGPLRVWDHSGQGKEPRTPTLALQKPRMQPAVCWLPS